METCNECGRQLAGVWVDIRDGGSVSRLCEDCGGTAGAPPVSADASRRRV